MISDAAATGGATVLHHTEASTATATTDALNAGLDVIFQSAWPQHRPYLDAFKRGLREQGYAEGQNVILVERWADGNAERFPDLLKELVQLKVDLIVVASTPGAFKRSAMATPAQLRQTIQN